jgi:hypothetical protein
VLELPSDADAARLLEQLGASPADREEALAARPDPLKHPELWRQLELCYRDLTSNMGSGLPADGYDGFPAMPAESDPVALHLYVWLYLAVLPQTLQYHAARGIELRRTWETLSQLGSAMAQHRSLHGLGGIGRFGQWCPPLKFRGAEYRLDRLEYDRGLGALPDGTTGFLLNLHIPPGTPLSPGSCDESLDLARAFFNRHFPEERVSHFVCHSWLLDPQLTEYLPEQSNLVRFLQRFELKPPGSDGPQRSDGDMLEYVFGRPSQNEPVTGDLLAKLPQDTSLRRAYVAHLQSGRHWNARTGWFAF